MCLCVSACVHVRVCMCMSAGSCVHVCGCIFMCAKNKDIYPARLEQTGFPQYVIVSIETLYFIGKSVKIDRH